MKKLTSVRPQIGADPEFFITSSTNGKIIESNKIIPKNGLIVSANSIGTSKCTIDGLQAEINPNPHSCREGACSDYINIFTKLAKSLNEQKANLCLKGMIHITPEELLKLSDDSKKFGCKPSINNYTNKESVITVNPEVYEYRSAGGHIHIGGGSSTRLTSCIKKNPKLIIEILDLVLGNTCVMIDRNSNQVERRRVYGRAGEYRLPKHGIEYRTLSNFWIMNSQLMNMVYGFARLGFCIAVNIHDDEKDSKKKSVFRELLDASNKKNVQKAINYNDFYLAKSNWDNIKHTLVSMIPDCELNHYPINSDYLKCFEYFIARGLDYWFTEDCLTHWTKTLPKCYDCGWENFLMKVVREDLDTKGNILWKMGKEGFIIEDK